MSGSYDHWVGEFGPDPAYIRVNSEMVTSLYGVDIAFPMAEMDDQYPINFDFPSGGKIMAVSSDFMDPLEEPVTSNKFDDPGEGADNLQWYYLNIPTAWVDDLTVIETISSNTLPPEILANAQFVPQEVDPPEHALSYITFNFGDDASYLSPGHKSTYETTREVYEDVSYDVEYDVELAKAKKDRIAGIKFEGVNPLIGEDGALETDTFMIRVAKDSVSSIAPTRVGAG